MKPILSLYPPVSILVFYFCLQPNLFYGQSFEGSIQFHVISDQLKNVSTVTIKGDKSLTELVMDSTESIKIIKDWKAGTSTILRTKNELKYGFKNDYIPGPSYSHPAEDENKRVNVEITAEEKTIDSFSCFLVKLNSATVDAEAWITNQLGFRLSKHFPQFLGEHTEPDLLAVRKAADSLGFIVHYRETSKLNNQKHLIEVTLQKKQIPIEAFSIGAEYLVLDEIKMKQLYSDAQDDPLKKKQWEEFFLLFGKKSK